MNIDNIMQELAQYTRLQEETATIVDGLKDTIKQYMIDHHTDTITGVEHKASYKAFKSTRLDTTALKKALPDIAAQYTKTSESRRFTFN